MLSKVPPTCWKVLGVAFTSILAPVGIRHLDTVPPEPAAVAKSTATGPCPKSAFPATRVLANGTGSTAEAAFQNALEDALRLAIVAEVGPGEWRLHCRSYLSSVRENGTGVLSGWREVSTSCEDGPEGSVFHSEVSVEVNVGALRERLRPADRPATH
jgi:hypothetical protein